MVETDLLDMEITNQDDRKTIMEAVRQLPLKVTNQINSGTNDQNSVQSWLKRINLEEYLDTFNKHLYHDIERIKRIWDVELSAVLDIDKVGHRKRILASVGGTEGASSGPRMEEINVETSSLVSFCFYKLDFL